MTATLMACVGCGARVPDLETPSAWEHPECSPGCWQVFGEVLAREYSDFRYARRHGLTVDAYSVQHPRAPSPAAIKSVAVHLIHMHLVLDRGYEAPRALEIMQRAASRPGDFVWLDPPPGRGSVTVADVHAAAAADEHLERVEKWARSVWEAWGAHHAAVHAWTRLVETTPSR